MRPRTTRHAQILQLAGELFAEQHTLTLDTIDGEFFWRLCQEHVAEALQAFTWPTPLELDASDQSALAHMARKEHLMDQVDAMTAFAREHPGLFQQVPSPVVHTLLNEGRLSMRPPLIWGALEHPQFPKSMVLVMHILSGEWTGEHVAAAIQLHLGTDPYLAAEQERRTRRALERVGAEAAELRMFTALYRDHASMQAAGCGTAEFLPFPAIEVVIALPLPDPVLIGTYYDLNVCARGWHEALPGGIPTNQEKAVAIRTWAVGLLVAAGMPFHDAMGEVCDLGDSEPRSQTRFIKDRRLLLERVPEAKPFVFAVR